ncbi:TPA: nucleocapsid protein [Escherichia coli]|nr:nucleocapsid protein [Escherichia coli]RCP90567.1 nucleocapsid protein [Escherichia coli]HAH2765898.1 nucleocapsid protein [Escherichia coli]HAH3522205.1 nucleocapsid protein [Escherichia coli]HAJ2792602.1 nucleocapsid protein [Escherichia coli]
MICRRNVICKNVLRFAGEVSMVRVLNNFNPLLILYIFCMGGFAPPPNVRP